MSNRYYLNDDEIQHFKYIKREKMPNGKWRYYYNAKAMKADKIRLQQNVKKFKKNIGVDAYKEMKEQERVVKEAERGQKRVEKQLRKRAGVIYENKRDRVLSTKKQLAAADLKLSELKQRKEVVKNAKSYYNSLQSNFAKTPLGKIQKAGQKTKKFVQKVGLAARDAYDKVTGTKRHKMSYTTKRLLKK